MLVIILEGLGYLFPYILELRLILRVVGFVCLDPRFKRTAIGTRIVVHVDYTIQSLANHVVHHLFHTVHPSLVDLAVRVYLLIPCHGNTDGPESCLLHHLDEFGLRYRLPPAGLVFSSGLPRFGSIVGIEGITQVPTHSHVLHGFFCRLKISGPSMITHH